MNKILLPSREPFPKFKLVFLQCAPPLGANAKMKIRSRAKQLPEYRIPVETTPPAQGHNDAGETIQIDTLGKWLFGVPGYQGHIRVNPYPDKIQIDVCSTHDEALNLLRRACEKLGLTLLDVTEYKD